MSSRLPLITCCWVLLAASVVGACGDDEADPLAFQAGDPDGPVSCEPSAKLCASSTRHAICNQDGDGYAFSLNCVDYCDAKTGTCARYQCGAGDVYCTSETTFRSCLADRSGWSADQDCPAEHFCATDHCIYRRCLGNVLLLVDRSGSMVPHWEAVRSGVYLLIRDNPKARFGILGFPAVLDPCGTEQDVEVPLATENVNAIMSWFMSHPPEGGTPLLAALAALGGSAGDIFGPDGGALVLLSDGEDTCAYTSLADEPARKAEIGADLRAVTAHLRDDFDVQIYVIGYNYDGDPSELNAIAAHGGTSHTTYIPAGDEAELRSAFKGIIDDFKLCF